MQPYNKRPYLKIAFVVISEKQKDKKRKTNATECCANPAGSAARRAAFTEGR